MLDAVPAGRRVSVERETFPALAASGELFGVATDDYWLDIGRPELLLQANLDRLAGYYDAGLVDDGAVAYGVHPQASVDPTASVCATAQSTAARSWAPGAASSGRSSSPVV